jgi:hypothetical protein
MKAYLQANGTKILFMAAVFSFLGVSIPKVATIFAIYEPQHDGLSWMWHGFSIAAAAGIDILAGYLTLIMMSKKTSRRDNVFIWTFIIALVLYSCYCNWLFDMLNNPTPTNVWSMTLIAIPFVGEWTVQDVTPVMVSILPVFIIAYAAIAHLVGVKKEAVTLSLADLKVQAREALERASAELTILTANAQITDKKIETRKASARKAFNWRTPEQYTDEQSISTEATIEPVQQSVPTRTPKKTKPVQSPEQKIRTILEADSTLSVRKLAKAAGVAGSTAEKWKKLIISEQLPVHSTNGNGVHP